MSIWTVAKLVHIFAGVFWIGAAAIVSLFLVPAVRASGPAGGTVMKQLMGKQKLTLWINIAAILTVLCGVGMYQHRMGSFKLLPLDTLYGFGLTVGSLAGLSAFLFGAFVQGRNARRMGKIIAELKGPPTPEQGAQIASLQRKLFIGGIFGVTLLTIALAGMILTHPL